jgi:hypothetical protein
MGFNFGLRNSIAVAFGLALALCTCGIQAQDSNAIVNTPNQAAAVDNDNATDSAVPELPPANPPQVAFAIGKLSIEANDSTLADVLKQIEQKTGAHVDMPAEAGNERVFVHLGPGAARDVLADLLYGLPYNYLIEGSDSDPSELHSLLLTPRKPAAPSSAPGAVRTAAVPRPYSPFVRSAPAPDPAESADNSAEESSAQSVVPVAAIDPSDLPPPPTGNHNDNRQVSAVATDAVLSNQPAANTDQNNAPVRPIDQMSSTLNRLYQARQQIQERQNQQSQPRQSSSQ